MGEAGRWAAGRGQPGAYLYVLGANTRAQAFYEAVGGVRGAAGRWQPPEGPEVDDLEYLWPDLSVLAALVPPGTPPLCDRGARSELADVAVTTTASAARTARAATPGLAADAAPGHAQDVEGGVEVGLRHQAPLGDDLAHRAARS